MNQTKIVIKYNSCYCICTFDGKKYNLKKKIESW